MWQIILIKVRRNVDDIFVQPRTRFQLNTPTLRILSSNLLRAGVDERIFLPESFCQRSKGLRARRSKHSKGAFLFSLRQDLLTAGLEDVSFCLGLALGFCHGGIRGSGIGGAREQQVSNNYETENKVPEADSPHIAPQPHVPFTI